MTDPLLQRRHWIFDLDGTLTVPVHDFDAMKRELGLPDHLPLLEGLQSLPAPQSAPLWRRVHDWEVELAARATLQPDAEALVHWLTERGARLGILTRNTCATAHATLKAVGLNGVFEPSCVHGRDSACPKPSPEGVLRLLGRWQARPHDAVMVGDYVADLVAGRAAGAATVLVDRHGDGHRWSHVADRTVRRLDGLLAGAPRAGRRVQ